jgi:phage baseplate assembly protein gpV
MSTRKVIEQVPKNFTRRGGDWAQEGGNNTLIVMGTDRAADGPATVDDGLGSREADGSGTKAGVIQLVAGRKDADGNPDFSSDDAFIYIAMRTNADDNLTSDSIGTATKNQPAIVLKSTDLRISFGGSSGTGNFKLYFDDNDKQRYIYSDSQMTQISVASDTTLTLLEDTIEAKVAGNTITIDRDGSVTITTDNKVNVKTSQVTIDCESAEITGDVTLDKTLTVIGTLTGADATFSGAVDASGDVTGAGISLSGHTHPVAGVSAGTAAVVSGPPT